MNSPMGKNVPNGVKRFKPYPGYKNSGIERLGEIPEHWEVKRLKNIVKINPDSLLESTDRDYILQYIDISNVEEVNGINVPEEIRFETAPSRARRIVRSGDTIISTVRTYLKAAAYFETAPDNLIASTGFAVLRPMGNIFPPYIFALVRCQPFIESVVANSVGVAYPAIGPSELGGQLAWFPPSFEEQRVVVHFLEKETAKIDALVAKKERLIELLREKRTALITRAVTKGLDPNVPMKDSGVEWLGEIPAYWELAPLKWCVLPKAGAIKTGPFGSQLLSSEMQGGEVKVYNQRTVIERDFRIGENYISRDKFRDLSAFAVFKGDVLVTTRGTIGRCAIVPEEAEEGILHPCLMRVQLDPKQLHKEYLALLIQDSNLVQVQLALASNATTIDVIYSDTMSQILLPRPPLNEQIAITSLLDRETAKIDSLIAKIREAIDRLKEYRTALISAAVTGKIDVREG